MISARVGDVQPERRAAFLIAAREREPLAVRRRRWIFGIDVGWSDCREASGRRIDGLDVRVAPESGLGGDHEQDATVAPLTGAAPAASVRNARTAALMAFAARTLARRCQAEVRKTSAERARQWSRRCSPLASNQADFDRPRA